MPTQWQRPSQRRLRHQAPPARSWHARPSCHPRLPDGIPPRLPRLSLHHIYLPSPPPRLCPHCCGLGPRHLLGRCPPLNRLCRFCCCSGGIPKVCLDLFAYPPLLAGPWGFLQLVARKLIARRMMSLMLSFGRRSDLGSKGTGDELVPMTLLHKLSPNRRASESSASTSAFGFLQGRARLRLLVRTSAPSLDVRAALSSITFVSSAAEGASGNSCWCCHWVSEFLAHF